MPRLSIVFLAVLSFALPASGQSLTDGLLQIGDPVHAFLQRQQAAGHLLDAFLSHQPLSVYEAGRYLDSLAVRADALSPLDRRLLAQYRGETPAPGAAWVNDKLGFVYANGRDMLSVAGDDYGFQLNPLAYLNYGSARQTEGDDREPTVTAWQNTRGLEASGHVGPVFFEARVEENQWKDVEYRRNNQGKTVPRLGFVKGSSKGVYDYFNAMGMVGFRSEHFEMRFGRDRNAWGPGQGSLTLSNYAPVYDQLQLRTTVWRLQYTNVFMAITEPGRGGDTVLPRSYATLHRLALHLPGRVELGLSEMIRFAEDAEAGRKGFDPAYLNPIIFYRGVEHALGSGDNALMAADVAWQATNGLRLYGQFVLDEFLAAELGTDWWGNKFGWQLGAAVAPAWVPGLLVRGEFTRQRPFLYAHRSLGTAYVHYLDGLGHPAGPNTEDAALFVDYRPHPRWHFAANLAYTRRGRAPEGENVGADPTQPYDTRTSDDAPFLQGVAQELWLAEAWAGYEVLPGLNLEATLRYVSRDDAEAGRYRYVLPTLQFRWGLPYQSLRY